MRIINALVILTISAASASIMPSDDNISLKKRSPNREEINRIAKTSFTVGSEPNGQVLDAAAVAARGVWKLAQNPQNNLDYFRDSFRHDHGQTTGSHLQNTISGKKRARNNEASTQTDLRITANAYYNVAGTEWDARNNFKKPATYAHQKNTATHRSDNDYVSPSLHEQKITDIGEEVNHNQQLIRTLAKDILNLQTSRDYNILLDYIMTFSLLKKKWLIGEFLKHKVAEVTGINPSVLLWGKISSAFYVLNWPETVPFSNMKSFNREAIDLIMDRLDKIKIVRKTDMVADILAEVGEGNDAKDGLDSDNNLKVSASDNSEKGILVSNHPSDNHLEQVDVSGLNRPILHTLEPERVKNQHKIVHFAKKILNSNLEGYNYHFWIQNMKTLRKDAKVQLIQQFLKWQYDEAARNKPSDMEIHYVYITNWPQSIPKSNLGRLNHHEVDQILDNLDLIRITV